MKSKIALVIPTIRENCFRDLVDRWGPMGLFDHCDLILMEDNPTKTFDLNSVLPSLGKHTHLCWQDIAEDLKENEWIIPRRSDTVRSYGYYYAWKKGYEFILTLDDDCYPPTKEVDGYEYEDAEEFINIHLSCLTNRSKWFNTLNSVKPRGFPFYNIGGRDDVIVNHGLWTNIIDYDAPTQLVDPKPEKFDFSTSLVPYGSYFPMCGMNVMWKAEYTVLMYHMLMGHKALKNPIELPDDHLEKINVKLFKLPFDRFGDIFCGILMKKSADMMGKVVSTGIPYIRHERASNPFTNLKKEANGLEVNEDFWEYVDSYRPTFPMDLTQHNIYYAFGEHVEKYYKFPEYIEYFKQLGKAMQIWAELFMVKR